MKQAACRLKTEGSLVASCCAGASDWKQRYLEPDNRVVILDRTHHAHFRGGRLGSGACTQCAAADEAHIAGPSAEDHVPCVTCKGGASAKASSQRCAEEHSEEKAPTEGRGSSIRRKRVEIAISNHRKQLVVKPKGYHIDILVNAIRPGSGEGHVALRDEQVIILDAN